MDTKFLLVLCFCFVVVVRSNPISFQTKCDFPPMEVTGGDNEGEWDYCDPTKQNDEKQTINEEMIQSICSKIQNLIDNCDVLKNISFPFDEVVLSMSNEDDVEKAVPNMCKTNFMRGYSGSPGCVETCTAAFKVCNVFVATEEILQRHFATDLHEDFRNMDKFIHPGKLVYKFPYPPRGSLHVASELLNCSNSTVSIETQTLCKIVAEVAINISNVSDRIKFDEVKIRKNVSSEWEPCDGLPSLLENVAIETVKPLKSNDTCKDTCNKGGVGICKMIFHGLESLKEAATVETIMDSLDPASTSHTTANRTTTSTVNLQSKDDNPPKTTAEEKQKASKILVNDNPNQGEGDNKPNGGGSSSTVDPVIDPNSSNKKNDNQIENSNSPPAEIKKQNTTEKTTEKLTTKSTTTPQKPTEKPIEKPTEKLTTKSTTTKTTETTTTQTTKKETISSAASTTTISLGEDSSPIFPDSDDHDDVDYDDDDDDNDYDKHEDDGFQGNEENGITEVNDIEAGDAGQSDSKTVKSGNSKVSYDEDGEDEGTGGHFMAYFLVFIVLCVAGYIVFHNKQKIIALVIEGKNAHTSRRPSTKEYKKLKTEDVMPSLEKSAYSKNYVF